MERPTVKLSRTSLDWVLEGINFFLLVFLILYPILNLSEGTGQIPTHFDLKGKPDAFGSSRRIWILPAFGVLLYFALGFFRSFPHLANIPVQITPENAKVQYRLITRMLACLTLVILSGFFYIVYHSVQAALGASAELGVAFSLTFAGVTLLVIFSYLFLCHKEK